MTTFTKVPLSASTNGMPVKVVQTATLGTTIHTAVSGTSSWDEVWVWAYNGHTVNVNLTIEYGGAAVPDQNIVQTIPVKSGLYLVVPGLILQNSLVVTAFASIANVITLSGYANRIA